MSKLPFYNRLILLDLLRLWKSVQHQIIIIAGICLPILLLLGLRNGHVNELRKDLVESPTGRRIVFYSTVGGEALSPDKLEEIKETSDKIELVIPELQRTATVSCTESGKFINNLSLYTTDLGDPEFTSLGLDLRNSYEKPVVVLNTSDAEVLGVKVGDTVELEVSRQIAEEEYEAAKTSFVVGGIVDKGSDNKQIAYTTTGTMYLLEQYISGYGVEEFGWPSLSKSPVDEYRAYLIITEEADPLNAKDITRLNDRDLVIRPPSTLELEFLKTIIKPDKYDNLTFNFIKNRFDEGMRLAPGAIMRFTSCSDVVFPWNTPLTLEINSVKIKTFGVTSPTDVNWFVGEYLTNPQLAFLPEESYDYRMKTPPNLGKLKSIPILDFDIPLDNYTTTDLAEDYLIVPSPLMSHLNAVLDSNAEFDSASGIFVKKRRDLLFSKARLYASTIDDVPAIVTSLTTSGFAVMAEDGLIREIQEQADSLAILVIVVGIGVFMFGIITVFSVLTDSTERKRGTIGILRVMGVSRFGIFYFVCTRAILIGFLSGAFTQLFAFLFAKAFASQLNISPTFYDYTIIFFGSMLISGFGAILPALKASSLDPYDAVIEGRFT